MPTVTHLHGYAVGARKGDTPETSTDGTPVEDWWEIHLVEPQTGNRIIYRMNRDIRDSIVRDLTGGIVLAGGGFPAGGPRLADGPLGYGPTG